MKETTCSIVLAVAIHDHTNRPTCRFCQLQHRGGESVAALTDQLARPCLDWPTFAVRSVVRGVDGNKALCRRPRRAR